MGGGKGKGEMRRREIWGRGGVGEGGRWRGGEVKEYAVGGGGGRERMKGEVKGLRSRESYHIMYMYIIMDFNLCMK